MEERLVPNVVGWLVQYGEHVGVIYGVVRDMPWLLEKKADGTIMNNKASTSRTQARGGDEVVLEEKGDTSDDRTVENEGTRTMPELMSE